MDLKLVKVLREQTGAGMLECKNALEATQNNLEEAIKYLEKNTKHHSQNQRVASKGLTRVITLEDDAILFEVNAETDFASKNPHFLELLNQLSQLFISSNIKNVKEALTLKIDGKSVDDYIKYVSGLMKEHIYLRRLHRIRKQKSQSYGHYMHGQGKLSVLVIFDHPCEKIEKEISMVIAASQPSYISLDRMDTDTINYENFLYEKDGQEFKSFDDFLNQKLLVKLSSIYDPSQTIGQILLDHEVKVIDFYRFELGQGIEDKLNCRLDIPCDGSKISVTPM